MDNERSGIRNRLRQTHESQMCSTFVVINSQDMSIKTSYLLVRFIVLRYCYIWLYHIIIS